MALTKKMINKTVSVNSTDQVNNNDKYLESKLVGGTSVEINKIPDGDGYALEITVPVPFVIDTFAATGATMLEVGDPLVSPAFTASYSRIPTAAVLSWTVNGSTYTLPSSLTSFNAGPLSTAQSTSGTTVTYTLTANRGTALTATKTRTFTWGSKVFWGTSASGANDETFIESLTSGLQTSQVKTFTVNATPGQYIYFACKSTYTITSFKDQITGFEAPFDLVATVNVTNANSVTESYSLYKSSNHSLGSTTVAVS